MSAQSGATIPVRVRLFARYAQLAGRDTLDLDLAAPATVADAVERVRPLFPGGAELPPRPLCAVNLMQVGPETPLASGDELALLPPLAGG